MCWNQQPFDTDPQPTRSGNRLRRAVIRAGGAVALVTVAGGALAFGITKAESHSGPAHDKKTEAAISRLIAGDPTGETSTKGSPLYEAGQMALHDKNAVAPWQSAPDITEINNSTDNGEIGYQVAFGDYPGTTTPNPNDVRSALLSVDSGDGNGPFSNDDIALGTPNSLRYLLSGNDFDIESSGVNYPVDTAGYTAMRVVDSGSDSWIDSNTTTDNASAQYYASGQNHSPIGTTREIADAVPSEIAQIEKALHIPPEVRQS